MLLRYINLKKVSCRFKHLQSGRKSTNSYTQTILLPQTKLPLRLEGQKLLDRDKTINELPAITELYNWQRTNLKGTEFVLHDGPPYANGVPHIGHVINKVLKDTIIRRKIIERHKVHYIPGWDCHGLPIELKAITDTNSKLTPVEIRQRARNFAKQAINKQKDAFTSWGVIGDWEHYYSTYNISYSKNQLRQFLDLYDKKLVYRDVKPVYWSPSSKTALAEAELEYNDQHVSKSLFLKLKLHTVPQEISTHLRVHALIWTTTPWSLPSNQAICYNPELSYSIVQNPNDPELFIIATNMVPNISKKLNTSLTILNTFSGHLLNEATYHHPFHTHTVLPFLPAQHASDDKGTGLVHTAPAHGPPDYLIALQNKLDIINLVDENGCYTSEAGPDLQGLYVLTDGNDVVLNKLEPNVVHCENYIHSYPYDWRTKKPIIIRASKQWFIDTDLIKTKATELLQDVEILPKTYSNRYRKYLVSNIQKRPYWCISRQRSWGVPIPVFYDSTTGNSIVSREIVDHLCNLMDTHGSDYWWTLSVDQLLPADILKNSNISINDIQKGNDIFDIWFDSGLSWSSVLENDKVADLYLEGVDQFTGWFQSSLITSSGLREKSPYKAIYVHGFAVDSGGLKMSKSLGNVIHPIDILQGKKGNKAYGIDALRWWVVCHASAGAIAHINTNVLQASFDEVHKIRSVMRFALGGLYDYKEEPTDFSSLLLIDKYMLHMIWDYNNEITEYYANYEFNKIATSLLKFLTNPVSSLYYTAIKDRLYCNSSDCSQRHGAQFVLLQLFNTVVRSIAPIIPHLAEELYLHLPQKREGSVFQAYFKPNDTWSNTSIIEIFENTILNIKSEINKTSSNVLNMQLNIGVSTDLINMLKNTNSNLNTINLELADIFQVSQVYLTEDHGMEGFNYNLKIEESNLHMCNRCRRVFAKASHELCDRCQNVTNKLVNKTAVTN